MSASILCYKEIGFIWNGLFDKLDDSKNLPIGKFFGMTWIMDNSDSFDAFEISANYRK